MGLADLHRRLCDWQLLPTVSENIRGQFETARNLMLYAWFVLEFQRVAEMQAYLSLELALRERLGNLTRTKQTKKGLKVLPLMLGDLLSKAVSDGLIIPEKPPSWEWVKCLRERRARDMGMALKPYTASEWLQTVKQRLPIDRNHLARGNLKLYFPYSFSQLELCGDLINALFTNP